MIRTVTILLLAAGLGVPALPAMAQAADASHHARKVAKSRAVAAPAVTSRSQGINAPSTDFSTIERADEEPRGAEGPSLHPAMGAGGMGLGGSF